jgi:hypothetical protein
MKQKLLISLLLMAASFSLYAQNTISLAGFGAIPYVQNENKFTVTFKDYGSFDFTGTIQPLSLETKVSLEQLNKLPGYKLMEMMELEEITLRVKPDSFILGAKVSTEKRLKKLCDVLKITAPYIEYTASIGPRNVELESVLDFSEAPVVIDISPKTGTRFMLETMGTNADLAFGEETELTLGVALGLRMRPTSKDPDLRTRLSLSYNLMTQEIVGAGSMTDTWTDPFGMSEYINAISDKVNVPKDAVSYSNTAVAIGWIPGSPSPTTIGFAADTAKFFNFNFGVAMSVAPADGDIALQARSSRMGINDFTSMLKDGFGLTVPTGIFPKDIYIEDVEILFSPMGGEIDTMEIDAGFAYKGGVKFSNLMSGNIEFYANTDDGFYLDMNLDAKAMYKMLQTEIRKVHDPQLKQVLQQAMYEVQLHKLYVHMEADMNLNMSGQTHCEFIYKGREYKFNFEASLSPEIIAQKLLEKLAKVPLEYVAQLGKEVLKIAGPALQASMNTAKDGLNKAMNMATQYAEHSQHSDSQCLNNCSPGRARELTGQVLPASDKAVLDFYNTVIPKLKQIQGRNAYETSRLRSKYIKDDWKKLCVSIDRNWEPVFYDEKYIDWSVFPERATRYGNKFRETVNSEYQKHTELRDRLWDKFMTEGSNNPVYLKNRYRHTYANIIQGLTGCTKIDKNSESAMWVLEPVPGTDYLYIKNKKDGHLLNIENGKLECNNIDLGAHSAHWKAEQVPGTEYIRFRNRWKGTYLNTEKFFESSAIGQGAWSSHWEQIPVRHNKAWNTGGDRTWKPGETILQSPNGVYTLVFQADGNLVLYRYADEVLWASGTSGKAAQGFRFQKDGNLVIYNPNGALWAANCHNRGGEAFVLEDDGSLVVHAPGAAVIWSRLGDEAWCNGGDLKWIPGETILQSKNKIYTLVFQKDGNLVVFKNRTQAIWHSGTHYRGVRELAFQKDGNFCIRTRPDKIIWASNSYNKGGEAMVMQNDGNLVIYAPWPNAIWASGSNQ